MPWVPKMTKKSVLRAHSPRPTSTAPGPKGPGQKLWGVEIRRNVDTSRREQLFIRPDYRNQILPVDGNWAKLNKFHSILVHIYSFPKHETFQTASPKVFAAAQLSLPTTTSGARHKPEAHGVRPLFGMRGSIEVLLKAERVTVSGASSLKASPNPQQWSRARRWTECGAPALGLGRCNSLVS